MTSHNSDKTGLIGIYDANDTTIMVDGHEMYDFQDGDIFTATYDQDRWTVVEDVQGTGTASKNNKTGGTITINLLETSPCNAIMEQVTETGNFPVDIVSSTYHLSAVHCYIQKKPDLQGSGTASNRPWVIKAINMDETPLVGTN